MLSSIFTFLSYSAVMSASRKLQAGDVGAGHHAAPVIIHPQQ
jgi:hypothetical protein